LLPLTDFPTNYAQSRWNVRANWSAQEHTIYCTAREEANLFFPKTMPELIAEEVRRLDLSASSIDQRR